MTERLDLPSDDTRSLLRFATDTWNETFMPEYRKDCEYVRWLKSLPKNYKGFVESEMTRVASKWYQPEEKVVQQPKIRKPSRNYTNYDVEGEE